MERFLRSKDMNSRTETRCGQTISVASTMAAKRVCRDFIGKRFGIPSWILISLVTTGMLMATSLSANHGGTEHRQLPGPFHVGNLQILRHAKIPRHVGHDQEHK